MVGNLNILPRKRSTTSVPISSTLKHPTTVTPEHSTRPTQDVQPQGPIPSTGVNDQGTFERPKHSSVDASDCPGGAPPSAPPAQRWKETPQVPQQTETSHTAQRKQESAREGPPPQLHNREAETLKVNSQEHGQRVGHPIDDRKRVRKDGEPIKGSSSAEIERLSLLLETANRDRSRMYSELRETRINLEAYASELDKSHHEIKALHNELYKTKDLAAESKRRLDIEREELRRARDESLALRRESNQLRTLLQDRTAELEGAQSFLTTADAFSGAEVTSAVQKLNAAVLQSTAFMAESMVDLFCPETTIQMPRTEEQRAVCKQASYAVGDAMAHILGTKKHRDNSILIQIAFQAYLTYCLRWIMHTWITNGGEEHNKFIDTIYGSIHEKEAQAIAGRWRALTRAHVRSTLNESQTTTQIIDTVIFGFSDILIATGCSVSKSDIASVLSPKFSDELSFLVSSAMRVKKMIGEDVTSGDFEVTAVSPETPFDTMEMENSYDSGKSAKASGDNVPKVLCATDLGVRKKTRVGMTDENRWEIKVLLKPKVVLESVVDVLGE